MHFRIPNFRPCLLVLAMLLGTAAVAGPFAGANGSPDEPKVAYNDPAIVAWATGWVDYAVGANCDASWQTPAKALGPASDGQLDGLLDIVCLGDGGHIAMTFDKPICDGEGWDFAVFENSFSDSFLELAFVEVSTDGVTFVRFDNCSLTPSPVGDYGAIDPSNIAGLAGKYRGGHGLGFDLAALANKTEVTSGHVRLNEIRHVRIVDIVGDGSTLDHRTSAWVAAHGANGPIYDPYPTTGSAGFDLDAVGVRHVAEPGFRLSRNGLALAEPGGTDTFTVVLTSPPDGTVVLDVLTSNAALATASPATLTFTPGNWFTAQSVTVTGVDNTAVGDNAAMTVTVGIDAAASDDDFDALPPQAVNVSVDNDDFTLTLTVVGDGNLDVGPGAHVLGAHNLPYSVTAAPTAGNIFVNWTRTGSGAAFAMDNTLSINGLTEDLALSANFAPAYTLTYAAAPGGSVDGDTEQTVIHGSDGTPVAAVPDAGCHFVGWSDGVVAASRQDTEVTEDIAAVANFAINEYTVIFRTDGTDGATVNGEQAITLTVPHLGDCPPVTALAPAGFDFTGWSGDYESEALAITVTGVTRDLTVIATFGRTMTVGSVFAVDAAEVDGLPGNTFTATPKIYAVYTDPAKGVPGKKATAKVLAKASAKAPATPLPCMWVKKIKLFKAKDFAVAQKGGESAVVWLAVPGNQHPLTMTLRLATKQAAPADQTLGNAQLPPPEITGITPGPDDAKGNATLILDGRWFGTKKPKAWREYLNAKGEIKKQACKVLVPDGEFADTKGKPACMDPALGRSQVMVILPSKDPGGLNGILVIDNGIGMAAITY
jgi:hypothetical protein